MEYSITSNMLKCPICNEELKEYDNENYICQACEETIPKKFASESKIPCCDPLNPCK
jgi:transcription initiation factor IIE alpha subunit